MTVDVRFRVEPELKSEAEAVLKAAGLAFACDLARLQPVRIDRNWKLLTHRLIACDEFI